MLPPIYCDITNRGYRKFIYQEKERCRHRIDLPKIFYSSLDGSAMHFVIISAINIHT